MKAHNYSVEERVGLACRRMVLILCAASVDVDTVVLDQDDIIEAISDAAREAHEFLGPIRHAPGEVADWAPDKQEGGE